jgi:two-component system, OmpR family, KDP operon response regulator KdpE
VQVNTTQAKILVVDDEPASRRVLGIALAAFGFLVAEAGTGEQALAALATDRFDIVLLDVEMPGMGGIEACRQMQQQSPRPAILMLSARESDADKARSFQAGANDYITKPLPLRDLIARVRAVLPRPSS